MAKKQRNTTTRSSARRAIPKPIKERPDHVRRTRQASRMGRILKVLRLIQSRSRWNAQGLADEVGCKVRTIYRDLQALEYAGVPWYYDQVHECYRVRPEYQFPATGLTEEDALGQGVATAVTKAPGLNIAGGAGPTTRKLAVASGEKIQQLLADAERLVEVLDLKLADHSQHYDIIRTIQLALVQRKLVSGQYESPYESGPVSVKLHPYRLCLIKNAWYLIGRATQSDQPQTYRVARFKTLRMLDTSALVPGEFDLREYFGNAWAVYRGQPTHDVEIRFAPEVARIATETIWHHTQTPTSHPDGSVTLTFRVDGLEEIASWFLMWAGRATVVQPQELREKIVKRLQQGLDMHR